MNAVCRSFEIYRVDLLKKTNARSIVFPRQICCYLFREVLKMEWTEMGRMFDQDHTTAMYSYRQIKGLLKINDPTVCTHMNNILPII
jgi:chromosomal replication initiator protein